MTFSSLTALEVVKMTSSRASNDWNFFEMTTFRFRVGYPCGTISILNANRYSKMSIYHQYGRIGQWLLVDHRANSNVFIQGSALGVVLCMSPCQFKSDKQNMFRKVCTRFMLVFGLFVCLSLLFSLSLSVLFGFMCYIHPCSLRLLHRHYGDHGIAPVPVK